MPPSRNIRTPLHRPNPAELHRQNTDAVTLIAEILAGTTPLPGAACTTRPEIFDLDGDPKQAAALCAQCTAADRCTQWAAALPPGHVTGVIAGQLHRYPTKRIPTGRRITA